MRRAIFPGTFDPFTIGHYSVVQRTLTFMDEVVIGIGINENKNTYFPIDTKMPEAIWDIDESTEVLVIDSETRPMPAAKA